jgi:putative Mg2+ transporter-C (MgtC) family protein
MNILWDELVSGLPDSIQLAHAIIRLVAAVILGGIIGIEREWKGKPAGLRTHILVTLGTALFVLACSASGMNFDGLSRVVQGLTTGIGFLGGGAILKLTAERDVQGLTTAAGIWMTAAVGVTVGLGGLGLALLATILTIIVLTVLGKVEIKSKDLSSQLPTKADQKNYK